MEKKSDVLPRCNVYFHHPLSHEHDPHEAYHVNSFSPNYTVMHHSPSTLLGHPHVQQWLVTDLVRPFPREGVVAGGSCAIGAPMGVAEAWLRRSSHQLKSALRWIKRGSSRRRCRGSR